ncbi:short-chain dehydrogenase [Pseudomonas sp. M47T1]|uniref:SDR family NAD(P)-dependent oxidoreductase n=1 Tax=Pseudomonas sp. M47T1 TaxID=1179778 RepID=UPI0002608086|nr:SDR family NAD(P)-dependent oxidoreductase [Pseudomonas sp. M47T1]EIK93741.1 short-chain dehydrogenase [Pseudomonas sp. M47T1]
MALLEGKVALITGAGRGLGAAYAKLLAEEGAAVVINDIGKDAQGRFLADNVAAQIIAAGGKAAAHTADISEVAGGQSLLDTALEAFGAVDILINNAGILRDKSLLKLEEADWDLVLKVNLKSVYAVTRPAFTWMKENGRGGVIVNTSSVSALAGNFGQSNYGASKGGVWAFSNVLTEEGRKYGIRVWTLAPAALSALTEGLMSDELNALLAPEHVAPAVLYMVSELSGQRTGHCLFASGQGIRELKLVAAEGIPGRGKDASLDAYTLAAQQARIFRPEAALTVMDFSQ